MKVKLLDNTCSHEPLFYSTKNQDKIEIINTDSYKDKEISELIYKELSNRDSNHEIEISYNSCTDYQDKIYVLANCSHILTSRLHVAVASYFFDNYCYAYNYSPKIKRFIEEHNEPKNKLVSENMSIIN